MLRQCPNLTFLDLDYARKESHFDGIDEQVCVMDKLTELRVSGSLTRLDLFHKIEAPSLRYLTVRTVWLKELPILLSKPRFGAPLVSANVYLWGDPHVEYQLRPLQALSDVKDLTLSECD